MAGFTDLLGTILQQGMTPSSSSRMGKALGGGGQGGSLEGLMGELAKQMGSTQEAANPVDHSSRETPAYNPKAQRAPGGSSGLGGLGDLLGQVLGSGMGNNASTMGGLDSLIGAITGGAKQSASRGSVGGGGLAMLASLAVSALQQAGQAPAQAPRALTEPQTPDDYQALEDDARVIVRAMINAAKADGQIGKVEMQAIVGKLEEDGISREEKEFFMAESDSPMDLDSVIASARHQPDMAAQIYAASFLAIEVDTLAEQQYMKALANGLGLHPSVAQAVEQALGL